MAENEIASEELVKSVGALDSRIETLTDELNTLRGERQSLINQAAMNIATFTVGQDVQQYRHVYRITRIEGEDVKYGESPMRIYARYFGKRIKKDGSLFEGREKHLYGDLTHS